MMRFFRQKGDFIFNQFSPFRNEFIISDQPLAEIINESIHFITHDRNWRSERNALAVAEAIYQKIYMKVAINILDRTKIYSSL